MILSKQGFSIIEIIVSTTILTIGVFGVYKLIGNNMNYIANNDTYISQVSLYMPMRECIKSFGFSNLSTWYNSGSEFSIHFGDDMMGCFTGSFDPGYSFSGIKNDNSLYYLFGKVTEKNSSDMNFELNIYNDIGGLLFKSGSENEHLKYLHIKNP